MRTKGFLILATSMVVLSSFFNKLLAQCNANQTKVEVTVKTDAYGYETFWQLKNQTTGTVLKAAGNFLASVPGSQCVSSDAGALANNTTTTDFACVANNTTLKFIVFDCYGDGLQGTAFAKVSADGQNIASFADFTNADSIIFTVPTPQTDLSVKYIDFGTEVSKGKHIISGGLQNVGVNAINSFQLNWTVDNGVTRKQTYTNTNIAANDVFPFKHLYGWDADAVGDYDLKVWVSDVNNNTDGAAANDVLEKTINVFENKRVVLLETFTNASCGPCAQYMPTVENIIDLTKNYVVSVAYHSDFPGFDIMNTHNPQQVDSRTGYYFSGSVAYPSWEIDGEQYEFVLNNKQVFLDRAAVPATFNIENMQVAIVGDSIIASADAVAISPISGTFRAHAVVIERVMDYTNGPNPGSNGEEIFDWVMKRMLTGTAGKSIGSAFVGGQTSNFGGSWKLANVKDTNQLAVVFWVQNNQGKEVQNANIAFLRNETDFSTPVDTQSTAVLEASDKLLFKVFPNPAENQLFVELDNSIENDVNIMLTDMLGRKVSTLSIEKNNTKSLIFIDTENLEKGIYVLQVSSNNISNTSKVLIQH